MKPRDYTSPFWSRLIAWGLFAAIMGPLACLVFA